MSIIHVAAGAGTGPTEKSAYDAALADANLHNYNLIPVSSVVPADAEEVTVDAAPDLGPAGNRLNVVEDEAAATVAGPNAGAAARTTLSREAAGAGGGGGAAGGAPAAGRGGAGGRGGVGGWGGWDRGSGGGQGG